MMQEQKDIKTVDVAAGIVFNAQGQCLLSSRPEGKPYAGYWEFAGGKLERGETALAALQQKYGHDRFVHEINGVSFHAAQAKANVNFCTPERVQQLKRELSEIIVD